MQDNGLMKYYRGLKRGKNLLNTKVHPEFVIERNDNPAEYTTNKYVTNLKTPEGLYYLKHVSKKEMDAEIIIPEIYSKMGLKSAISYPAGEGKKYDRVVSNDVSAPNIVLARNHNLTMLKDVNFKGIYSPTNTPLYLPVDYNRRSFDYSKFITPDGMKDLQLKRVADCICEDTDGHDLNFFYILNEEGLINGTISIDHAMAGCMHGYLLNAYQNEFSRNPLTRDGMLNNIKVNESLHTFITPNEIVNVISNVNVPEISRDIKGDLGYKLDNKFVSDLDRSFDDFAESLIKA